MAFSIADSTLDDIDLGLGARHARTFFNNEDLELAHATPGSFAIMPSAAMIEPSRKDYEAMAGVVFGTLPDFSAFLIEIEHLQNRINQPPSKGGH